jgi:hypothetical protein
MRRLGSKHFCFISAGPAATARIYLMLRGGGSGCCVGSLTILTAGKDGNPKVVFSEAEHLVERVLPLEDGSGIQMIGQASDSEARAEQNAESYDPYLVYVLSGEAQAHYDRELSRAYTTAHYCEWAGPRYNERFVAVGNPIGSAHCRVMTEQQFSGYFSQHPAEFRYHKR